MGHVFTICIRIENENEAWFFPSVHVRCFVPVVLCTVPLFHFVIFVSLPFSFNEESGFVAGRRRRRRTTGGERRWQGGRGQTRVECNQGADGAKGHVVSKF